MGKGGHRGRRKAERGRETPRPSARGGAGAGDRERRGWDRLAWLLFVVLGILFFWDILFGHGTGRRYFWDDFVEFVYPARYFAATTLAEGQIPMWNPYVFSGMPFLADIQSAVLYPLNLALNLFVPGGHPSFLAVEVLTISHLVLAGILMFALARRLGVTVWGAWVSGITFMFSGFLVTHVIHLNVLEVAVWLPLAFLFLHMAFFRESLFYAVLAGAVLAVAFLGGSPQIFLLVAIGLGLFTLYSIGRVIGHRQTFSPSWLRVPVLAAIAVGFALGLSLFQLLPSYALSKLSVRPELTYGQSVEASFPPLNLVTFFIPRLFGDTAGGDFGAYWGVGSYYFFWELCGYVGVVGLLLAWIGFRKSDRPHRGFLGVLFLIALLMAAGKYGGIHRVLFAALPGYDRFRVPARALLLLVFAASVLAGYGAEVLTTAYHKALAPWVKKTARGWGIVCVAVLVAAIVIFRLKGSGRVLPSGVSIGMGYFTARAAPFVLFAAAAGALAALRTRERFPTWLAGTVLVGLVVADLFVFGRSHNLGRIPPEEHYRSGTVVDVLRPEGPGSLFRAQTRGPGGVMLLKRNQGEIDGVFSIDGYNQLKLSLYETFDVERSLKLDLLNTRYRLEPSGVEGTYNVVEAATALPRVWVVPDLVTEEDDRAVLDRMNRNDFDPRRTVVLERKWERRPGEAAADGASEVTITRYSPNRIETAARLDGAGFLVFSEVYYPDWVAYVDGVRRPVYRADYALRAVPLEAGEHRVVLAYESAAFRRGLWVGGFCLLAGLGVVVAKAVGVGKL